MGLIGTLIIETRPVQGKKWSAREQRMLGSFARMPSYKLTLFFENPPLSVRFCVGATSRPSPLDKIRGTDRALVRARRTPLTLQESLDLNTTCPPTMAVSSPGTPKVVPCCGALTAAGQRARAQQTGRSRPGRFQLQPHGIAGGSFSIIFKYSVIFHLALVRSTRRARHITCRC